MARYEPLFIIRCRSPHGVSSTEIRLRHLVAAAMVAVGLFSGSALLGLTLEGPVGGGMSLREEMAVRLADIEAVLTRKASSGDRSRQLAGLGPIDPGVRLLGTGGAPSAGELDPHAGRIRALRARCELQAASYRQNKTPLAARRRIWQRIPLIRPVPAGYISSRFGGRIDPFTHQEDFHAGLDIRAPSGSPVYATADGVVAAAGWQAAYGLMVVIDHGVGLETRYAHAGELLVSEGDKVHRGQLVARVGSSGRVTAPHLHYEVRRNGGCLDPERFLAVSFLEPD
jgi:murein DD-endopeptidase MepM/ murein hydrolase activator NlpD